MKFKILIVGGYGTFGGRLVDLLLDQPELVLMVGGRNLEAAKAFCKARESQSKAELMAIKLARDDAAAVLAAHKPAIVVDASGPFQVYGDDPFGLVKACIAQGCHYVDLADGADFVLGISAFDGAAKKASVFALSGMSSFPVLTAAIGRVLARDLDEVHSIQAGIAPSPFAGVGLNVIKAIASYAGRGIDVLVDGGLQKRAGFFDSRHMQVNVPGKTPLLPIRFALAEVPDLKILAKLWPSAKTIWMGAGPTPALLHRLLWLAAGLVKIGLLKSLLPFAPIMNFVVNTVRWGEHRGGLVFEMTGLKNGKPRRLSWHLLAEGDGGPLIPSMAAASLIVKFVEGHVPTPGARSGHEDLHLTDYQNWFDRYGIATGRREENVGGSIYQQVLGEAYEKLEKPLQDFHAARESFAKAGKADISNGKGPLAKLVRLLFGFPQARKDCPLTVNIGITEKGEHWDRRFDGKRMSSCQELGNGRQTGLIVERFGAVSVGLAMVENGGRLELIPRSWRFLGLPMPKFLLPSGQIFEHGANDCLNFNVEIRLPVVGSVVSYKGWLRRP